MRKIPLLKAQAYTAGLKIKKSLLVQKIRTLPINGDVIVNLGDTVDFDTVVAKTMIQGEPVVIPASEQLGLSPDELKRFMLKNVGDPFRKGDLIAKYNAFFGLINRSVASPIDGTIEHISISTGRVTLRGNLIPLEIKSYIPGRIVEVIQNKGVVVQTNAAFVQGIFGIGGENHGEIIVLEDSPDKIVTSDMIVPEHKGKILVGGSLINLDAIKKANETGVAGIVVGGIRGVDLSKYIGYEIGVAITGQEEMGSTLIITEGFGRIPMSSRTFELFRSLEGRPAAINGATQIRAGVLRPEIIIPQDIDKAEPLDLDELVAGMTPGTRVRIIREPYFGSIGTIDTLPVELNRLETGSLARVAVINLEDERKVIVPRANLEIIEE